MSYFDRNKKKKKMIKLYKYFLLILILLNSCQSAQNALSGSKKNNSDEFMVEKKSPLVLPPEFEKLPEPGDTNKSSKKVASSDFESILKNKTSKNDGQAIKDSSTSDSLEKSILEKIQKN